MNPRPVALGIVVPAFNTTVETEYAERRPAHVRHFVSRIAMPDRPLGNDSEQAQVVGDADEGLDAALVAVAAARPDAIALGISVPAFWNGVVGAALLRDRCEQVSGLPVALASDAIRDALLGLPAGTRVGLLTPYQAEANARVRSFVEECGVRVVAVESLEPPRSFEIALVEQLAQEQSVRRLAAAGADVIVQVGTNVPMGPSPRRAVAAAGCDLLAVNDLVYDLALLRAAQQGTSPRITPCLTCSIPPSRSPGRSRPSGRRLHGTGARCRASRTSRRRAGSAARWCARH